MKKHAPVILTLAAALLLGTDIALAEGPSIEPGKWEYTITMNMPMMGEKVQTDNECVTEEEAKQDPLAMMIEEGNCTVVSKEVSGNTLSFEIECEAEEGVTSNGKGHFTGEGTTASGEMVITTEIPQMGGKTMTMTQKWEGKRIGDCD